ncbi:MAG: HAD hydrolase-like protein [Mycobacteriaceae bacterium]|nr:HAD hydrolase-like protein [Mycobacteriaceae bacterium]
MPGQAVATRGFWWDRTRPTDADVAQLRAVIFDLDGAMADIERDGQRVAFNAAFAAHGLDIRWDDDHYARLVMIGDERRRIATDLRRRGFGAAADEIADDLLRTKDAVFTDCVLDGDVVARSGLIDAMMSCFVAGVWVAVVSTGRRAWVEPLVRQLVGDGLVETIVTADDVTGSDPQTDVYELALWELGVGPESALAMVGSAAGMRAASSAGLAAVVVPTAYTASDDFTAAVAVRWHYDGAESLLAPDCQRLHRRWWSAQKRAVAA